MAGQTGSTFLYEAWMVLEGSVLTPLIHSDTQAATESNFDELRHGKTFARTRRKYGKKRAQKQMVAIALRNKRDAKKRVARKRT